MRLYVSFDGPSQKVFFAIFNINVAEHDVCVWLRNQQAGVPHNTFTFPPPLPDQIFWSARRLLHVCTLHQRESLWDFWVTFLFLQQNQQEGCPGLHQHTDQRHLLVIFLFLPSLFILLMGFSPMFLYPFQTSIGMKRQLAPSDGHRWSWWEDKTEHQVTLRGSYSCNIWHYESVVMKYGNRKYNESLLTLIPIQVLILLSRFSLSNCFLGPAR